MIVQIMVAEVKGTDRIMIELLDTVFRFSAVVCCALTATLAIRDARCQLAARLASVLSICTIGFLLVSAPGMGEKIGQWMVLPEIIGMATPAALWLFSLSLFDDKFRIKPVHILIACVFWLSGFAVIVEYFYLYGHFAALSPAELHSAVRDADGWFYISKAVGNSLKIVMIAHMLFTAWQGRDGDLLESRRKFRATFVVGGAIIMGVVVFSLSSAARLSPESVQLVDLVIAAAVMAIVFYLLWNVTRIDSEWLLGDLNNKTPNTAIPITEPADALDLDQLNELATNAALLEQGLTITKLAEVAKVPEHRLRRLINQHMGFRNFSDFLNHHRVEAAKDRLADTGERHTPVLTIAMDLGYGSLGPFNRAFKERTGKTPTEFRRGFLGGA